MNTYKYQQRAKFLFRDWFNNFLSVEAFAAHHLITIGQAEKAIKIGREIHNREAEFLKRAI